MRAKALTSIKQLYCIKSGAENQYIYNFVYGLPLIKRSVNNWRKYALSIPVMNRSPSKGCAAHLLIMLGTVKLPVCFLRFDEGLFQFFDFVI